MIRTAVLGLWIAQTEGAKFWLHGVTELKNRGVQDICIACVDGLKGFPEAIEAVYPKAAVQLGHPVEPELSALGLGNPQPQDCRADHLNRA